MYNYESDDYDEYEARRVDEDIRRAENMWASPEDDYKSRHRSSRYDDDDDD